MKAAILDDSQIKNSNCNSTYHLPNELFDHFYVPVISII